MDTKTIVVVILAAALSVFLLQYSRGARAQLDPDAKVIAQLKKAGSDLSKPHLIEFLFYFPSRESADRVASTLKSRGFSATTI